MTKIRVLLANHPRLMREVIRELINGQQDMEVVDEALDPVEVLVAARETKADAVILATKDSKEPGLCSHLLAEYPNLTILCLAFGGESAFIEQLCPRRMEIVHPSEASILSALRQGIRASCSSEMEL